MFQLKNGESSGVTGASGSPRDTLSTGILFWGLAVLLFFVPLVFFSGLNSPFQLPQTLFLRLGVLALVFLGLAISLFRNRIEIFFPPLALPVLVFVGVMGVSAFFSPDRFTSFFGSHGLWFGGFWSVASYAVIYWIAALHPEKRVRFLAVIMWSSLVAFIYLFCQRVGWDPFWKASAPAYRFSATFGNPVYMGGFAAMAVPISLYFCLSGRGWLRVCAAFICGLNFLLCLISMTRGAWLGLTGGLVLWLFLTRKYWRKELLLVALLSAGSVVLSRYAVGRGGNEMIWTRAKVMIDSKESSAAARLHLWKSALRISRDHPLAGVGLDLFGDVFPRYQDMTHRRQTGPLQLATNAHNELLQVVATTGIPGLGAYLWLWASILVLLRKAWRQNTGENDRLILAGISASCLALETHAFFNFSVSATSAYLWCWLGILASYGEKKKMCLLSWPVWVRAAVFATAGVVGLLLANIAIRSALADWHYQRGENERVRGRSENALLQYEAARKLNRHFYPAYTRLAIAHVNLYNKDKRPFHLYAALKSCALANQLFPNLPDTSHNLGLAYQYLHTYLGTPVAEEAVKYFERSLELAPMYPEFWTRYGTALEQAGHKEQAQKAWLRALEIIPSYVPAMEKLGPYLPKRNVRFIEQEIILRNVPLGLPVRISKSGQAFKLMNLEDEDYRVIVQIVPTENTPFIVPAGYRSARADFKLELEPVEIDLKANSIAVIDGTLRLPDDSRLRGKKFAFVFFAGLSKFDLPAGAFARLLIEISAEGK
ncbi:MAG TPA: hypothetical protein DCL44_03845 [Elusimicrobia bacterium]|nr:hypothetical protein [Elusimicrobiota bacterium]